MSASWKTKWGVRRIRHDPPTLAEAIVAAQGFSDDREEQAAIAAGLMGRSVSEAKDEMRRLAPDRRHSVTLFAPAREKSGMRAVIVERKTRRHMPHPTGGLRNADHRSR